MRYACSLAAALPLALLASAHSVQPRASDPEIDALNAAALAKLRARHPQARAVVLGSDSDFGKPVLRRQNRASATAAGAGAGGINSAAIAAIGSTTSQEPNIPALATPTAGTSAPISGAPALPAATIVPSQWPTLDRAPPTDSSFVQGLLSKLDLSKVPNIPVTQLGGCQNTSNAAAIAAAATNCWWTCGGCTRQTDVTVCPNTNTWGLSYDDGPSPDTPRLLQYMDAQSPPLKATMFVVGSRAISRPQMLQYEYLDGMQICVHTWSHTALTTQTNEQIVAELGWTREAIRQITGVSPTCMRPPYGDIDDRVRYIAGAMSMTPIIWTRANGATYDTQDWQIGAGIVTAPTVVKNFETILQSAPSLSTGFIVLEHDLYQQSVSIALNFVLPYALSQKSLTLEPIISCQGKQMSENYLETRASNSTNPTSAVVGSTGTGVVSIPAQSGSASGSSGSTTKSGASALSTSLLFAAAPAVALAALIARLA